MALYIRLIVMRLGLVFVAVLVALLSLAWMGRMIQYMDVLRDAELSVVVFLSWVALILPYVIYVILPFVAVLTSFIVYNHFYNQHVLTILGGAGLSDFGRLRPAIYFGLICCFIGLWVSINVLPTSYHLFKLKQNNLRQQQVVNLLKPKHFFSFADKTFYIENIAEDKGLEHVFVYADDNGHNSFVYAKAGRLIQKNNETFLLLKNGYQSIVNNNSLSKMDFDQYQLRFAHQLTAEYQRRSMLEFSPLDLISKSNGSNDVKRWVAGHLRLLYPLFTILCAIYPAWVFVKLPFSRRSGIMRPFIRVVPVAIASFSLFAVLGQVAETQPIIIYCLYLLLLAGLFSILKPLRYVKMVLS